MITLSRVICAKAFTSITRSVSTTAVCKGDAHSLMKLKQIQSNFQREDGVPIFLKGGVKDKILYNLTLVLCGCGLAGVFHTIYRFAIPPSWKQNSN